MFNKNKKAGKIKGFTLIELLIVMLIITVVGAISIPLYMHAMEKSRASEPISLLNTIANAEQRYKIAKQEYTDQLPDLDIHIEPYTQGNMTPSTFDTEYFDFTLEQEKAIAVRKEGADYTLAVDYETGEVTCAPGESRICTSLNLTAGEGSATQEEVSNQPQWGECPESLSDSAIEANHTFPGSTCDSYGRYDSNGLPCYIMFRYWSNKECLIDDQGNVLMMNITQCTSYDDDCEDLFDLDMSEYYLGYSKVTCERDENSECVRYTGREEFSDVTGDHIDENTWEWVNTEYTLKTCSEEHINQEDGTCLEYDAIYRRSGSNNIAECINILPDGTCDSWYVSNSENGYSCYSYGSTPEWCANPCYNNPGGYDCCMYNPSYPGCDPCMYDPMMCGGGMYSPECDMSPGSYECCMYYPSHWSCGGMGNPCDWDGIPWGENRSYECCSYDPYYDYEGCRWYRCDYWGEC